MSVDVSNAGGSARKIANNSTTWEWTIPREVQDITGLDKSARETLLTLADFTITINGVFNDASNMSHDVFKTVSSTSIARTVTLTISGQTLPNEVNFTDYSMSRGTTGELTWTAPGVLAGGTVPTWA